MSLQSLHEWPAELQIQVFNEVLGVSESKPTTIRKDADAFEIVLSDSGISKTQIQRVNTFISCIEVPLGKEPLTTPLAQDRPLFTTFLSTTCDDTYKYFNRPDDLRSFTTNLKPWLSVANDLRPTLNIGICIFEDASKFKRLRDYDTYRMVKYGCGWKAREHCEDWMKAIKTLHWIGEDTYIEVRLTVFMAEPWRDYSAIRDLSKVFNQPANTKTGSTVRLENFQTISYGWPTEDYTEDDHFALLAAAVTNKPVPPTVQISGEAEVRMRWKGCRGFLPEGRRGRPRERRPSK